MLGENCDRFRFILVPLLCVWVGVGVRANSLLRPFIFSNIVYCIVVTSKVISYVHVDVFTVKDVIRTKS
jgi:hypothetical protein